MSKLYILLTLCLILTACGVDSRDVLHCEIRCARNKGYDFIHLNGACTCWDGAYFGADQ